MSLPLLLDWPITLAKVLKPTNLWSVIGGSLFTLFFLGWGVFSIIRGGRNLLTRARVEAPVATLSNSSPRVGEVVKFSYRQTFRNSTDVPNCQFQLIMRESATYRAGTDAATDVFPHIVQEERLPAQHFDPGETLSFDREFQVRDMHSFDGASNEIDWFIYAQVEMAGLPAFTAEYPLEVQPELAR